MTSLFRPGPLFHVRVHPKQIEKRAKAAQTAAYIEAWEAYREELKGIPVLEQLPIASPDDESRRIAEEYVPQLVTFVQEDLESRSGVLEALATQMSVEAPGQRLQGFEALSRDEFLAEVTKRRPKTASKLKPADLKYLREIYNENAVPIQDHRRRALAMQKRLADLVNRAYGLTPDEIELLWSTAPPRMPVGR